MEYASIIRMRKAPNNALRTSFRIRSVKYDLFGTCLGALIVAFDYIYLSMKRWGDGKNEP